MVAGALAERLPDVRRPRETSRSADVVVVAPGSPDGAGIGSWATGIVDYLTDRARSVTILGGRALITSLPRRPGLVIGITPTPGGAAAAARLAARHEAALLVAVRSLVGRSADPVARRLERYALRRADRVVVGRRSLTPAVAARGVAWERIGLVPDWQECPPAVPDRDRARDLLGWHREPFIVLHAGPMGMAQDLDAVVDAAALLPGDVRIVLAGDGSRRAALAARAARTANVSLIGPPEGEAGRLVLTAADLLLVNERTSFGELPPPPELTAYLAAGRPVLAAVSPAGPTARAIRRTAGAGLVLRPADPSLLATAILALRRDEALRTAMARRAVAYASPDPTRLLSLRTLDTLLDV